MAKKKGKYKNMKKRQMAGIIAVAAAIVAVIAAAAIYFSMPIAYHTVVFDQDNNMTVTGHYRTFPYAKKEMYRLIEEGAFNPAVLNDQKEIVAIRYGIVDFKTKTPSENTYFSYDKTGKRGYINGSYGADGIYIDTSDDAATYKFKLSGAIGWVSRDDVRLLNYFDPCIQSVNHYQITEEDELRHYATYQVEDENHALAINIGSKLPEMGSDIYYSYDGHYFYTSFETMADDYRNDTYENSINPKEPFYNYYQFLSARAVSGYTAENIDSFIEKELGYIKKPDSFPMESNASQLYGEGNNFIDYQNAYGSNAIMMLSLAINESGYGQSEIAYTKNNLFGHAAYDNAPMENANGYKTVGDSIMTHAQIFVSKAYLNPCDGSDSDNIKVCADNLSSRYNGSFFGDKGSGMGVSYASDPYWGEKAASFYRRFDRINGYHDSNRCRIGILQDQRHVNVYAQPDTSSKILYKTPDVSFYTAVILEETTGESINENNVWYKVQSDVHLNSERTSMNIADGSYDFAADYAYIHSSYFLP